MKTGHDSRAVANHILQIGAAKGIPMSMMKLIKLVYFSHGWLLAFTSKPLCADKAEAWQYGPVFRKLYNALPYKGSAIVAKPITEAFQGAPLTSTFDEDDIAVMNRIVDAYGKASAFQLSELTHKANSPWDITMKQAGIFNNIDDALIENYFKQEMQANLAKKAAQPATNIVT